MAIHKLSAADDVSHARTTVHVVFALQAMQRFYNLWDLLYSDVVEVVGNIEPAMVQGVFSFPIIFFTNEKKQWKR